MGKNEKIVFRMLQFVTIAMFLGLTSFVSINIDRKLNEKQPIYDGIIVKFDGKNGSVGSGSGHKPFNFTVTDKRLVPVINFAKEQMTKVTFKGKLVKDKLQVEAVNIGILGVY